MGLEALDVDLQQRRQAMARDQRVERRGGNLDLAVPDLLLPAFRPARRADEGVGGRRNGGVGAVDPQPHDTFGIAAGGLDQRDLRVAAMDQPQRTRRPRLRFERDHMRTKPTEAGDAVADMRADVEGEVAPLQKPAVESVHRRMAGLVAVIDPKRPADGLRRAGCVEHGIHGRASARIACSTGGGSKSSGMPQRPRRANQAPSEGSAVAIAKGIASR